MTRRGLAAAAALVAGAATIVLVTMRAITEFPRGLELAVCLVVAVGAAWFGARRRGAARLAGFCGAAGALVVAVVLLLAGGPLLAEALSVAGLLVTLACARVAVQGHADLHPVPRPQSPVLFMNPHSGGGKARRFALADEAKARGIEAVELSRADDLRALVRNAIANGADALAMAGGDGSQAIVAGAAASHGLAYACIPAGTRNHFALDLGVDRDDVVGALDAFVDGGERTVDLAEVNGRVFVNNVSLGIYAEAVQRSEYRDAKLRTLLDTVPDVVGPKADEALDLGWTEPDGREHHSGAAILVSNNRYRLGRAIGSGTRPRIDGGTLGVTVVETPEGNGGPRQRPWHEWSTPAFQVEAHGPVPAGVDGEALRLDPPLRFRSRPAALRVRIARKHPGASPSAGAPESMKAWIITLGRMALGREAT